MAKYVVLPVGIGQPVAPVAATNIFATAWVLEKTIRP